MPSSTDIASSIAPSMYNYDETSSSSSGSGGSTGSDDDNTSNYDDETQEDNVLAQYKMPSMGTIPTVAPGRDRSRLPAPADGDESTFSSAVALTSGGGGGGGGSGHDGDNNSSSSSGDTGGDGYYNDDATMTSRTSASLMDMTGQISSQPSSKKMKPTKEDSGTSPEFTVQSQYHASTDTFPTSNVAGAASGSRIGGGGHIGDGGGLRMERSAHRSKHRYHHHHGHHKSSKVEPRGVEPSPFLPYDEEDIVHHDSSSVGGKDESPPTDPNLKPGEGLKPYLPYDSSSDEEYTPSEEYHDEVHVNSKQDDDGSDDALYVTEDHDDEQSKQSRGEVEAVAAVAGTGAALASVGGNSDSANAVASEETNSSQEDNQSRESQEETKTKAAAAVAAGTGATLLASVGKDSDSANVSDTSGISSKSPTTGATTEEGESPLQNLSNTSDEEKDGREDRDMSVAAGAVVLASAAAARNARPATESTISTPPNVAGSDDTDTTPQPVADADNDNNGDRAMNTSGDSEKLGETAAATSTLRSTSTGGQRSDPIEIARESHDTTKDSERDIRAAEIAKDVAAVAAIAALTSTEEGKEPIPVNESSNAQEEAIVSSVQSRSLVSEKESERSPSTIDQVKSADAPVDQQDVVSNANDIEEGAVREEQEGTPVEEVTVSQKSAAADDGSETSRTKPAIWIARGVLVASVLVIVILAAIFIPRRENEPTVPTVAPSQVILTAEPSLPPSSSILPVPTAPTTVPEPTDDLPTMSPSQIQQTPSPVLTTPTILPATPSPAVETPSPTVEMINDFEASSIFGGRSGNEFGTMVSLTSDGNFLAVLNLDPSDPVQAFSYRDTLVDGEDIEVWNALSFLPVTIFDGTSNSVSGADVSTAVLSSGNSVVALSSMYGFEVFELIDNDRNGTAWNKKGPSMQWESPITGVETKVKTTSLAFSDDGSILAAGFINEGQNVAVINVFQFDEQTQSWIQSGDVISKSQLDMLPLFLSITLSLSGDGTVLAVGTSLETTPPSATVEVLRLEATSWTPMGDRVGLDSSSISLDLSQNGHRLAVAVSLPGSGAVYEFDGATTSWEIVSNPFLGGSSISMNSAGTRVVVGDSTVNLATVYSNIDGGGWRASSELTGDAGSRFGYSVSIAGNGNRFAVGAPEQDQGEGSVGRVVFYE
mmetsp:Transcript_47112/g.115016  ORF Transcript_47112/g.115016 Transcript_47112/m.115016 type:complete len:1166 (+) Transcript_47112:438-3935(+)